MIIVTLYILGPASRVKKDGAVDGYYVVPKGTGGTDVVKFLKGVRDTTAKAVISGIPDGAKTIP